MNFVRVDARARCACILQDNTFQMQIEYVFVLVTVTQKMFEDSKSIFYHINVSRTICVAFSTHKEIIDYYLHIDSNSKYIQYLLWIRKKRAVYDLANYFIILFSIGPMSFKIMTESPPPLVWTRRIDTVDTTSNNDNDQTAQIPKSKDIFYNIFG